MRYEMKRTKTVSGNADGRAAARSISQYKSVAEIREGMCICI